MGTEKRREREREGCEYIVECERISNDGWDECDVVNKYVHKDHVDCRVCNVT